MDNVSTRYFTTVLNISFADLLFNGAFYYLNSLVLIPYKFVEKHPNIFQYLNDEQESVAARSLLRYAPTQRLFSLCIHKELNTTFLGNEMFKLTLNLFSSFLKAQQETMKVIFKLLRKKLPEQILGAK